MPNKRIITAIIAVVLVVGVGVGSSLAYLTDLAKPSVTYTVGKVDVKLTGQGIGVDETRLFPGRNYDKEPYVELESGSEECYVRIKVKYDADLARVMKIPAANTGWERDDSNASSNEYYYYYTESTLSRTTGGRTKTRTPAFDKVIVSGENPDPTKDHMELIKKANDQSIYIEAQAIQAEGFYDTVDISKIREVFRNYD